MSNEPFDGPTCQRSMRSICTSPAQMTATSVRAFCVVTQPGSPTTATTAMASKRCDPMTPARPPASYFTRRSLRAGGRRWTAGRNAGGRQQRADEPAGADTRAGSGLRLDEDRLLHLVREERDHAMHAEHAVVDLEVRVGAPRRERDRRSA